jgi:restriction system protein
VNVVTTEQTLWGIHAGRTGDADSLFTKNNVVALGWARLGDLSKLPGTREAFKKHYSEGYPDASGGTIPTSAGQLFRFVHEMKLGDLVCYPAKSERVIHIGRITGAYIFDPSDMPGYPHRRSVQWLKVVPRTQFSQGALYEIGSALSLFQIRNYADEYVAALEGKAAPSPVREDESVPQVVGEVEESTRDFILKTLAQQLKGHPFADFVAHLLGTMGYRTRVSPEGPDGGVDIIAHRDELGFEPPIIKVQVKSKEGSSGDPEVSQLYGKLDRDEKALFITLGTFTSSAKTFARGRSNLRLIDGEVLVDLILAHYEEFDSKYKAIVPLKRVYAPDREAE